MLARRLATLDQLSGGRVVAGLGQGYSEEEFQTANVSLKRRGGGFEEFIRAMRAAWAPDPVDFHGRFYRIPESQIGPKPMQSGGPPVIIAAEKVVAVERAARIGDGLNPLIPDWDWFDHALKVFRTTARAAGRDPGSLQIVVRSNTTISDKPVAEPRTPLGGSH